MKIYTRLVYGWRPDGSLEVEEADSFDYEGPVALCGGGGKGGSKAPPPPDYAGAARTQGGANLQSTIAENVMNRPQEVTPLGSRDWTQTGNYTVPATSGNPAVNIPTWRSDISLTPEGQNLYDRQLDLSTGLMDLGQGALDRTSSSFSQPFDFKSVGDLADQSYGIQTARLDPQWNERAAQEHTRLANQGLAPGGEAYDASMRNFNQGRNDAYQQARLAAQGMMPQTYQLATALRQQPLTELSAIRSGAQPQMPQFQPFATAGTTPAPMYQAAQAQGAYDQNRYNQEQAQQNSMTSGLFGLAGALGGPWGYGGFKMPF